MHECILPAVAYVLVRSVLGPPIMAWYIYAFALRATALPLAWRAPMAASLTLGTVGTQVRGCGTAG